jgi:hypothetical protein
VVKREKSTKVARGVGEIAVSIKTEEFSGTRPEGRCGGFDRLRSKCGQRDTACPRRNRGIDDDAIQIAVDAVHEQRSAR